ncbi:MAG: hypothetical protein ACOCUF_01190 [Patescibacteria group bacterium]
MNRRKLKKEIKNRIDEYRDEFFYSFLFNIVLILFLIIPVFYINYILLTSDRVDFGGSNWELLYLEAVMFFAFLEFLPAAIFLILIKGLIKKIKILIKIRRGDFDLDIKSYEMDHATDFLQRLPLDKKTVKKLKRCLSFENIIEVLEYAYIIKRKKGYYVVNCLFDFQKQASWEESFKKLAKSNNKKNSI